MAISLSSRSLELRPRNKKLIAFECLFGWFVRDQRVLIPSNGRRPIVIKTAAEPHGVEAL